MNGDADLGEPVAHWTLLDDERELHGCTYRNVGFDCAYTIEGGAPVRS